MDAYAVIVSIGRGQAVCVTHHTSSIETIITCLVVLILAPRFSGTRTDGRFKYDKRISSSRFSNSIRRGRRVHHVDGSGVVAIVVSVVCVGGWQLLYVNTPLLRILSDIIQVN